MYFVDTIEVPGLGNRSYLAGGPRGAVAVDPPRDIDRMIGAAARRGVGRGGNPKSRCLERRKPRAIMPFYSTSLLAH